MAGSERFEAKRNEDREGPRAARPGGRAIASVLFLAAVAAPPASAQAPAPASPTPPAIGIGLEGVPYPYKVDTAQFDVDGHPVRMAYMDAAPATGRPKATILLLHGKNFASDYWASAIKGFVEAGYRVIAPDQVGFGKSSKPDIDYSFDTLALNTAKLMSVVGIEKAIAVGHSMGGMLAVRTARLNPDRITHLVLENPIGLEDYRLTIPPQTTDTLIRLEMSQSEESYRRFVKSYFPNWKDEYERFVTRFVGLQGSPEYPRLARVSALTYQMIYREPIVDELPTIRQPTLLVIGQKDRTVVGRRFAPPEAVKPLGNYPELGRRAQKLIPKATLVELPESGHVPHLEEPVRFVAEILRFLDTAEASPSSVR